MHAYASSFDVVRPPAIKLIPRLPLRFRSGCDASCMPDSLNRSVGRLIDRSFDRGRSLDVSANQITELPPCFADLRALRWLSVSANQLTALPLDIGERTAAGLLSAVGRPFPPTPFPI